jgi:hypothetical protein
MICDDFNTESYLNTPWNATATNAGNLNGSEKFTTSLTGYTVQQNYDAVAWLANQLLGNVSNPTTQTNISFAIWDIMDGQTTDPDGGATGKNGFIAQAFAAVVGGYVGSNVEVFTPSPDMSVSQEFLVVNGPTISTPEPVAAGVLGANLVTVLGLFFFLRRRRAAQST